MRYTIMAIALLLSTSVGCATTARACPVKPVAAAPHAPVHVNVRAWVWVSTHHNQHGIVHGHWALRAVPRHMLSRHPHTHVRYVEGHRQPRRPHRRHR